MVITKTNRIISFILVICMIFSMLPVNVFATEIGNNSNSNSGNTGNSGVEGEVIEDVDRVDAIYTVKYYKDSIESEDNLLGKYQVNSYAGYELDFDEINLNVYLPEEYDGGIVVKSASDKVVKENGSSVVYVLYTPATPEGQELLNKVKAENEAVEDITEHLVFIEDSGFDKFTLSFETNISTIKSDTIPTDTILVIDASSTMLSQQITVNNVYTDGATTISGKEALMEMVQAFTEYYFETQPENSKLGIVYYGYNYMHPYDKAIELTELGSSSVEEIMNQVVFNDPYWIWNNGVHALKKAKDMLLNSESMYIGQDGNSYERARHVIFITSDCFKGYESGYETGLYNPGSTSNNEALNQAAIIKGKLGDDILANYMSAVLSTGVEGTLLANYQYGYGSKTATDKNEAWKNMQFNDEDFWSHTAGNFDRVQTGANATFHSVGLLTSKLTAERKETTENWLKEMADKGEYYAGDNTADLYGAIEDIIADMYVANDIYLDVIVDENFKVIEADGAFRVLRNSDNTTTVQYGPIDCNGIFHIAKDLVVAARKADYKEDPTYRVVAYTYVNGQKVLLTQHDKVQDSVENDSWVEQGYTPITSFEYELVGTTVILKKHIGTETEIKIAPNYSINGLTYKTTKIGNECFKNSNITSIELADDITKIGMEAFRGCVNLTNVKLPANLDALYNGTFRDCVSLKEITFPENMTYLGSYAFYNTGLTSVDIIDNIHYVGLYCFAECKDLVEVDLSRSLDRVQNHTFENCVKLAEIDLPDNVYGVNDYAFNGCTAMTEIDINPKCYMIGQYAFANCPDVTELTLAETTIYSLNAFEDCNKLEKVTMVDGPYLYSVVANYDSSNYMNSVWYAHKDTVKEVRFEEGIEMLGTHLCYQMPELESVYFAGTIVSVRDYLCYECPKLVNVTMEEGIDGIRNDAFANCDALTEIVIPNSVTWMWDRYTEGGAFANCDNLTKLTAPIDLDFYSSFGLTPVKTIIYTPGLTGRGFDSDRTSDTGWTHFNDFYDFHRSKVENVVFSEGITYIGANLLATVMVYDSEPVIRSITLPSTLEEIGAGALNNGWSKALASTGSDKYGKNVIYLPNVTKINHSGMRQVTGTEPYGVYTLVFGKNVYLDDYALYGTQFEDIIFEDGVSYIGSYALSNTKFANTKKHFNLTGITEIDDYGLAGLPGMETITIGDDLISIGTHAFDGSGITELILGSKVQTIKPDAFVGANKLMHIFVDEANPYFETNEEGTILWNEDKTEILWISDLYAGELFIPKATTLTTDLVRGKEFITKIVIEEGNVTEIPVNAFADCYALKEVIIPNGVTILHDGAFRNCVSLVNVTIPEGVTEIHGGVFFNCDSLITIDLPSTLTCIGNPSSKGGATFSQCDNLVSIVIPEGVTHIYGTSGADNNRVFGYCPRLESVTLPSTLISGATGDMFVGCNSLANVYLGEGSTYLSVNEDSTKLMSYDGKTTYWSVTHVYEEETELITEIPDNAYKNNTSLRRYEIADTIVRIGVSAFHGSGLAGIIEIPSSVTEIGTSAFDSTRLKKIIFNASVTTIPNYCFSNNGTYLTEFIWNTNTVTTIGAGAFQGMKNIKEFNIPEGVETINGSAFAGCSGAEVITLPSTLTGTIGQEAFSGCSSLKEMIIPEGVTGIGGQAFLNCKSLEYVYIPSTVTSIDFSWRAGAFGDCPILKVEISPDNPNYSTNADGTVIYNKAKTSIVWANPYAKVIDLSDSKLTTIPQFKNRTLLEKVIFPETATMIYREAFMGCTSLKEVVLNEGLTKTEWNTFQGCTSLKELTLPSTMTYVVNSDFINTGLEHIYVADGNTALTTNEDSTALYNADKTACYWAKEYFRVNDESYKDLQTAINAANNGDIIYVVNGYTMTSAVTIPANKELTIMSLDKSVIIYQPQNCYITTNSKLTIKGNGENTLTFKRTYNYMVMFNANADMVLCNGVRLYGNNKNYESIINGYNDMTLTIESDVIVGLSNKFFNNTGNSTYVIAPGVKFENFAYIVTNENGTYENLSATFTNCDRTLDKYFEIGGVLYSNLQDVINVANSGDIVYVLGDCTLSTATTIPTDKELFLMPKDRDVVITQNASITNNSKLTIAGNDGYTITLKSNKSGCDNILAYADIVLDKGAILYGYAKNNNLLVNAKSDMTLTVKDGAVMKYAKYAFYNNGFGTYDIQEGAKFEELTYIVYAENGTYENLSAEFVNCDRTLDKPFMVGEETYLTLQEAVNAAIDGDTIYVCTDYTITSVITIPADKELTLSAYKKDVIITQANSNSYITNNSKLTIKGNDGHTLTVKTNVSLNQFQPYADLVFDEGAIITGYNNQSLSNVWCKANVTVTIKDGAKVGNAKWWVYNSDYGGTYVVEPGATFENLTYIASNKNGTYTNKTGIFVNCTDTLDAPIQVGDKLYYNLQDAINAANSGDVIYILENYTMTSAVTIPADKELTLSAYDKDVQITQADKNHYITANGPLTITGNVIDETEYTLTIKATTNCDQIRVYAPVTVKSGASVLGAGAWTNFYCYNGNLVTVEGGATVGNASQAWYGTGTYEIHEGAKFINLGNMVSGTHSGKVQDGVIYENVGGQLTANWLRPIMVNEVEYYTLQEAIENANDGDIIYILENFDIKEEVVIPDGKNIIIMPYDDNITITQYATITNNGGLTLSGTAEYKLVLQSVNTENFSDIDSVTFEENVQVCKNTLFSLKAAESNIVSGKPGWNGNWNGVYWENLVDYGYDLNFEFDAKFTGTYYFYATAAINTRNYKLYVDNVLIGTYTDSLTKVPIELTAGTHTIRVTQDSGYTPMWDTFYVEGFEVVVDTKPKDIKVNNVGYDTLEEAIENANNGDIIYIVRDVEIGAITIPADKELTIMPYNSNVTISQSAAITNNSNLTISGNGEYTLTFTTTSIDVDNFTSKDTVTILDGAYVCKLAIFSLRAADSNIVSGTLWNGTYQGVTYTDIVDLGYDLNFDFEAPVACKGYFYATAVLNERNFNLYVDDVLIGTYSNSLTKVEIDLTAGTNTIRVTQASGYTPMWDTFYIEYQAIVNSEYTN